MKPEPGNEAHACALCGRLVPAAMAVEGEGGSTPWWLCPPCVEFAEQFTDEKWEGAALDEPMDGLRGAFEAWRAETEPGSGRRLPRDRN